MDPRTATFLAFIAFSFTCFALGYTARRRGWAPERWSRPIHLHTVIWAWSPVSLLAFWGLPLHGRGIADVLKLMAAQPVLMVAAAAVMAALTRLLSCDRRQRGVMILAAGLSNHGWTLGAYLCYTLLDPAADALRFGVAYVTSMQLFMVLIFYPIARHYGPEDSGSVAKLIAGSFLTARAMPLYAAVVGATLNLAGLTIPAQVDDWRLMDVLFFAGAAGAYGGIGLRFRLGDTWHIGRLHAALAAVQFIAHPLLTAALIALLWAAAIGPAELPRHVMLIESFTPTALNTVMVSNLFHLDARLASVLWLWNSLLFIAAPLPFLFLLY